MRALEPWYRLASRHAPPSVLTLDYTATSVYWLPVDALRNKHYLLFTVSIVSLLAEVLIVCLSSFGLKGTVFLHRNTNIIGHLDHDTDDVETFASFWWSFGISVAVLTLMLVATSVVMWSRRNFILPRAPGTIASTMAYACQGKLLYNFVDIEKYTPAQRLQHMQKIGKTYGFGWYSGRDGEVWCGIDEEPLLASYQHGLDYRSTIDHRTVNRRREHYSSIAGV